MITAYSDYDFYTDTYKGELSETDYSRNVIRAHSELTNRTLGRTADDMEEALKYCECEIVDTIYNIKDAESSALGISSINNDGYTINYESSTDMSKAVSQKITEICVRWLTNPINLISRWV